MAAGELPQYDLAVTSQGRAPEEWEWAVLRERDRTQRAAFVFAVVSTGVYCRPGCPARTPGRQRVRIFADGEEASRAGHRPCRRCLPEVAALSPAVLTAVRRLDGAEKATNLKELGAIVGLAPRRLRSAFRRELGVTPSEYRRARLGAEARARLASGAGVTEAIYAAGFQSSRAFYEQARLSGGIAPLSYRRGATGETVRFSTGAARWGALLVAAAEKGLCDVRLGPEAAVLEEGLRSDLKGAILIRDDAGLEPLLARITSLADELPLAATVPLEILGTAFQARVWRAIREIPRGHTLTYSELAAALGAPRAVRAVASACAANRLALVVPCHRVVPAGGGVGGYRWGSAIKARLLAEERGQEAGISPG